MSWLNVCRVIIYYLEGGQNDSLHLKHQSNLRGVKNDLGKKPAPFFYFFKETGRADSRIGLFYQCLLHYIKMVTLWK